MYDNKKAIKTILIIYVISRIVLISMMIFLNHYLIIKYPDIKNVLHLFDNVHYLNIANNGYTYNYQYAFFPLTPIVIHFLGKIGTLILNQILTITSAYLLYIIGKKYLKINNPVYPAILWLISPISIFTLMFYSENLFIFLTLYSYYLYKQKKHYLILGIIIGLSVMTRNLGSMLFFTIFIFMIINCYKHEEKIKNVFITYIPATIISCLYPIYLYTKTNNFFYFIQVQYQYWFKVPTNIFRIFFDVTYRIINDIDPYYVIEYLITFFLMGFILYKIIKDRKNKSFQDLYLYILLTIISISSCIRDNGQALTSFYRFIFGCFPIYYMIKFTRKNIILIITFTIMVAAAFLLNIYFF